VKIADDTPVTTPSSSAKPEPPAAAAPPVPAPAPAPPPAAPAVTPVAPAVAAPAAPQVAPAPVPAPAPPARPQNVAPTALDANRIAGEKDIIPDDITQAEIGRAGVSLLVGNYKVCITTDGSIASVSLLQTTGYPAYDTKIQDTIRSKWRYRPFIVNGKATSVCTAVRFIYSQQK
jgi:hypothetical protein